MLNWIKTAFKRLIVAREAQAASHIRNWRNNGTLPPVK